MGILVRRAWHLSDTGGRVLCLIWVSPCGKLFRARALYNATGEASSRFRPIPATWQTNQGGSRGIYIAFGPLLTRPWSRQFDQTRSSPGRGFVRWQTPFPWTATGSGIKGSKGQRFRSQRANQKEGIYISLKKHLYRAYANLPRPHLPFPST